MNKLIQKLSWDTKFFGWKIGSISLSSPVEKDVNSLINEGKKQKFSLLYVFLPGKYSRRKKVLNQYGGVLVDKKVTFKRRLVSDDVHPFSPDPHIHSYFHHKTTKQLNRLAYEAGHMSRFYKDRRIPRMLYRKLYETWVRKSLNGKIADNVLVYQDQGVILGFITYQIQNSVGKIGLVAVSRKTRGKAIGTKLMRHVFYELKQRKIKNVYVVTQLGNKSACAFYLKNGYHVYKKEYVFHFWL